MNVFLKHICRVIYYLPTPLEKGFEKNAFFFNFCDESTHCHKMTTVGADQRR